MDAMDLANGAVRSLLGGGSAEDLEPVCVCIDALYHGKSFEYTFAMVIGGLTGPARPQKAA
jgi:hypothetical protein